MSSSHLAALLGALIPPDHKDKTPITPRTKTTRPKNWHAILPKHISELRVTMLDRYRQCVMQPKQSVLVATCFELPFVWINVALLEHKDILCSMRPLPLLLVKHPSEGGKCEHAQSNRVWWCYNVAAARLMGRVWKSFPGIMEPVPPK